MPIAVVDLSASGASGSIPFSGNAVLLHATSPFTVTYTVNAVAQPSKTVNNVQSAMAAAPPAVPKTLTTGNTSSQAVLAVQAVQAVQAAKAAKAASPPQPTTLSSP